MARDRAVSVAIRGGRLPLIFVFYATLLVFCATHLAPAGAIDIQEGKPAPPLEANLIDGTSFSLAGLAGEVVVINFWATWCVPCREEMPALEAYYRKHRAEGLHLLAISVDDPIDDAKVREVMRDYTFPAAFGREAQLKPYGRIWRVPLTFVIDRSGVLRKDGWHGNPKIDLPTLEQTVTPLLQKQQ
jgi:cytochrome c biogenesis protein CcmG, thiol:disulfide interchange protein DsbE